MLRAISDKIQNSNTDVISLPLNDDFSDNINLANGYEDYVFGDDTTIYYLDKTKKYNIKSESEIFDSRKVVRYKFFSDDLDYHIGARDIIEGHAYLIEQILYTDIALAPDLPYRTVEMICWNYSEWLFSKKDYLAVLCEIALSKTNPADFFMNGLFQIRDEGFTCSNIDTFIKFLLKKVQFFSTNWGEIVSINNVFRKSNSEVLNFLLDTMKSSQSDGARKWISELFKRVEMERLKDPIFITRGIFQKNPRNYYFDLIKKIGSPLIFDGDNKTYIVETNFMSEQIVYFPAISEIIDLFLFEDKKECGLKQGCLRLLEVAHNFEVNENCDNSPWNKCNEKKLCPVGYLLKCWGLSEKQYTK